MIASTGTLVFAIKDSSCSLYSTGQEFGLSSLVDTFRVYLYSMPTAFAHKISDINHSAPAADAGYIFVSIQQSKDFSLDNFSCTEQLVIAIHICYFTSM